MLFVINYSMISIGSRAKRFYDGFLGLTADNNLASTYSDKMKYS